MAHLNNVYELRKDAPRNKPRVEIEIEVYPNNLVLPSGMLGSGKQTTTIYIDELPIVQALVEDNLDGLRLAQQRFEDLLAEEIQSQSNKVKPGTEGYEKIKTRVMAQFTKSVDGCFRDLFRRDIRPLKSLKVIKELPPPPGAKDEKSELTMLDSLVEKLAERLNVDRKLSDDDVIRIATQVKKLANK
jgi:hypothetical protein